jgi:hypothetical protein
MSEIGFHWPKSPGLFSLNFGGRLFAFGLPASLVTRAMLARAAQAENSIIFP